jgi:hypothetical protein
MQAKTIEKLHAREMLQRVRTQVVNQNKRKSKWAIIRNTHAELIDTTLNTFLDHIPEMLCPEYELRLIQSESTILAYLTMTLTDKTVVESEFIFLALDKDEDIHKLMNLALTGVWINEAEEIPLSVVKLARCRVQRYPSKRDGGYNWSGVLMDTNPPDAERWTVSTVTGE